MRQPALQLGGWATPHRNAATQIDYLLDLDVTADFCLTQVVSHHDLVTVERFLNESSPRGLTLPGLFGMFYYRSANPHTLDSLAHFLPVPRAALEKEFTAGTTAEEVCTRSFRGLHALGVRHFHLSNLPVWRAPVILSRIMDLADIS